MDLWSGLDKPTIITVDYTMSELTYERVQPTLDGGRCGGRRKCCRGDGNHSDVNYRSSAPAFCRVPLDSVKLQMVYH